MYRFFGGIVTGISASTVTTVFGGSIPLIIAVGAVFAISFWFAESILDIFFALLDAVADFVSGDWL
jgi:hypothetical protein